MSLAFMACACFLPDCDECSNRADSIAFVAAVSHSLVAARERTPRPRRRSERQESVSIPETSLSSACACMLASCMLCAMPPSPVGPVQTCQCYVPGCAQCSAREAAHVMVPRKPLLLWQPTLLARGLPLTSREQPDSSMMWLLQAVQQWQCFVGGCTLRTDYCAFDAPWRKRTRIHFSALGFDSLARWCPGGHEHICLSGWDSFGFRTAQAATYPEKLALVWASAVDSWWATHGGGMPKRALELFSGEGNLSAALRAPGWAIDAIDLRTGQDVTDPTVLDPLLAKASAGYWCYIHAGTPCTTFSRAKHPAARSSLHPAGLPHAPVPLRIQARDGNRLVRITLRLFQMACRSSTDWAALLADPSIA
jgi:hypothetical protein